MIITTVDQLLDLKAAVLYRRGRADLPEPTFAKGVHPKLQAVANKFRGVDTPLQRLWVPADRRDWSVPWPEYEQQTEWIGHDRSGLNVNQEPDPDNPAHIGNLVNVSTFTPRVFDPNGFPRAPYRTGLRGDGVARHRDKQGNEIFSDLGEMIAVDTCFVRDGLILFGVRKDNDTNEPRLCLIGGKVDPRERLKVAAERETREETTVHIDKSRLVLATVRVMTDDERNTDNCTFVSIMYRYDVAPGEQLNLKPTREISAYYWLEFDPQTGAIANPTGLTFYAGHDKAAQEMLTVDYGKLAEIRASEAARLRRLRRLYDRPLREERARDLWRKLDEEVDLALREPIEIQIIALSAGIDDGALSDLPRLLRSFAALSPSDQALLRDWYLNAMPAADIADAHGFPQNRVSYFKGRAAERFLVSTRKTLEPTPGSSIRDKDPANVRVYTPPPAYQEVIAQLRTQWSTMDELNPRRRELELRIIALHLRTSALPVPMWNLSSLERVFGTLTSNQQQVLLLRFVQDRSYSDMQASGILDARATLERATNRLDGAINRYPNSPSLPTTSIMSQPPTIRKGR